MTSRSDELRAHRFAVRRLVGVVITQRVDADAGPWRRGSGAALASVALGLVCLAVVAVAALVAPAAADWRRTDAVIVERETGARYVYLDGVLHPVLNYASARLIIGAADAPVVQATRHQLTAVAHGGSLGIAGAPDSLPAAVDLMNSDWSVCSVGSGAAGNVSTSVAGVVLAGVGVAGRPLADGAILGRVPGGMEYLIWHGRRFLVRHPSIVLTALGLIGATPTPLATALVDTLPAGADLDVIRVPGAGARSAVAGLPIGEVVTPGKEAGVDTYAVVTAGGLAVISALAAAILLNDPATPRPGVPVDIAKPEFASAPHPPSPGPSDWPPAAPEMGRVDGAVCVPVDATGVVGGVVLGAALAGELAAGGLAAGGLAAGGLAAGGLPAGDAVAPVRVVVPPGRGVLVRGATAPGVDGGAVCLLTDAGRCFPVADTDALASLGYGATKPVALPATVVALLPRGVTLSRAAASAGTD